MKFDRDIFIAFLSALLSAYIFKNIGLHDFLVGWFSCMIWDLSPSGIKNILKKKKQNEKRLYTLS